MNECHEMSAVLRGAPDEPAGRSAGRQHMGSTVSLSSTRTTALLNTTQVWWWWWLLVQQRRSLFPHTFIFIFFFFDWRSQMHYPATHDACSSPSRTRRYSAWKENGLLGGSADDEFCLMCQKVRDSSFSEAAVLLCSVFEMKCSLTCAQNCVFFKMDPGYMNYHSV